MSIRSAIRNQKNAQLEPRAQFILDAIAKGEAPEGTACFDAYAVSIAISLKRIADRMEATSSIFENGHGQMNVGADVNANVALNG